MSGYTAGRIAQQTFRVFGDPKTRFRSGKENGGEGGIRTLGTGFNQYNGLGNRELPTAPANIELEEGLAEGKGSAYLGGTFEQKAYDNI